MASQSEQVETAQELTESILDEVTPEYPLSRWDVDVSASLTAEGGFVRYVVRVSNKDKQIIRRIVIRPDLLGEDFTSDEGSKMIGPLSPGESATVAFNLVPTTREWSLEEGGGFVLGRDLAAKMQLQVRDGEPTYELTLTNNLDYSLRFISIAPIIPFDFLPLEASKTIDLLRSQESVTLSFPLMDRARAEQLQGHLLGLRNPFLYGVGRPKRRKQGYPRHYTKEELAEIRRKLLFLQADEDLLRLIRNRGLEFGPWEVGHILPWEQLAEFDFLEYSFWMRKFAIGEPIDMDPYEETFDFELLYIEPLIEFPAEEVGFDIEHIKEVKPLDLEGAQLSDIELEPMELEL